MPVSTDQFVERAFKHIDSKLLGGYTEIAVSDQVDLDLIRTVYGSEGWDVEVVEPSPGNKYYSRQRPTLIFRVRPVQPQLELNV